MSAKQRYILALDCGSTNFKVAVFDSSLRRISELMEPLRYTVRVPERVEFDPDVAWRMSVRLIREACAQAGMGLDAVCTIALTSQANTFCALDSLGHPLIPFMSWQDQRAMREAALLNRRLGHGFHQHCSWPRAVPGLQASMLLWLRLRRPQIINKIVSFVTLPGYLSLRMGGANIIDPNMAAMDGLYSLRTGRWWPAMLKLCGIEERQLPKLIPSGKAQANAVPCRDLQQSKRANVVLAGNDQSAGAFGNYCSPKTMLVTLGTAIVVYRIKAQRGPYTANGCWGPYPGGGYYELVTRKQGCLALDWACSRLVMSRNIAIFTEMARKAKLRRKTMANPETEAMFYPEALNTERVWVGSSDPEERALSVFEGIGFALKQLIEDDLLVRSPLPAIRVTGGGSTNLFWLQVLADILGARVARGTGDALYGAARMASPHALAARDPGELVWYDPQNAAAYAARFERWKKQRSSAARQADRKEKG
jgi:sugar (pentulose or hexulose) kinase